LFEDKSLYRYHAIASNRPNEDAAVTMEWYSERGDASENRIKDLKVGFGTEYNVLRFVSGQRYFLRHRGADLQCVSRLSLQCVWKRMGAFASADRALAVVSDRGQDRAPRGGRFSCRSVFAAIRERCARIMWEKPNDKPPPVYLCLKTLENPSRRAKNRPQSRLTGNQPPVALPKMRGNPFRLRQLHLPKSHRGSWEGKQGCAVAVSPVKFILFYYVRLAVSGFSRLVSISGFAFAFAIAFALPPAVLGAEGIQPTGDPEIAGPASAEQGAWRTRIQQVFDPATRTLSRLMYTMWDPEPSRDLDFVWTPDRPSVDKPGRISGAGHLVWRIKGKPSYEQSSVFAAYRGTIRNGRIDGRGTYLDHTGLFYEGEWRSGLVQGGGTLKLPGGDEYIGQFRAGKANGMGRYIDVTGEIYEGPFVSGRRHGRGTTTLPNGRTYSSLWINGEESERSRFVRVAQGPGVNLPGSGDDIRIGILVDKRLPRGARELEPGDLLYAIANTPNGLAIRPEDERLMSMWKSGGEIQLTPDEETALEYGVLSKTKGQSVPLTLVIEVRNRSASSVAATGAYLDVRSSVTDTQPAIQLVVGPIDECSALPLYRPKFALENFGWGAAEQATLRFGLINPASSNRQSSSAQSLSLGRIDRTARVDLDSMLRSAGVKVAFLSGNAKGLLCRKPKSLQACLQDLKASGTFGSLNDKVTLNENNFVVIGATGRLEYSWRDARGASRQASSPFTVTMPLTFLRQDNECGEGGAREPITATPQQLRLDASNYRVPVSFRATIPAGRTSQLTLPVKAAKSSEHDFTMVLQLSDGREIRSQPINLLYYVPSWFRDLAN
jgi:hypothetical protein